MARFRLTAPKIQPLEKHVVEACITILNLRHYWTKRLNTGVFRTLDGRWHTEGTKGDPDYVALHRTFPGFLLEFKRPGGKLTPEQYERHYEIRLGYQIDIAIVDSTEALERWLDAHENRF